MELTNTNQVMLLTINKREFRYYDFIFALLKDFSENEALQKYVKSFNHSVSKRMFEMNVTEIDNLLNLFSTKSIEISNLELFKFKFILLRTIIFVKHKKQAF